MEKLKSPAGGLSKIKGSLVESSSRAGEPGLILRGQSGAGRQTRMLEYQDKQYCRIPVSLIEPDADQVRRVFDADKLESLAESIKSRGILEPVLVRVLNGKEFRLVAGERRYRAACLAGVEEIPAIVTDGDPMEIALIENLHREDLNTIEEAEGLGRLMETHKYTQEQVGRVVGKSRSMVAQILTLRELPEDVKEKCLRANISKRTLLEIAKVDTGEEMRELFERVVDEGLTSDDVRKIVKARKGEGKRRKRRKKDVVEVFCANVKKVREGLKKTPAASLRDLPPMQRKEVMMEVKKLESQVVNWLEQAVRIKEQVKS